MAFSPLPAGTILAFGGSAAPSGWLLCNGATVSRSLYAGLFAAISGAWGTGDGSTTFHLPDLRGRFLRGVDGGSGRDPNVGTRTAANAGGNTGNAVGSVQANATAVNGLQNASSALTASSGSVDLAHTHAATGLTNAASAVTGVAGTNATSAVTGVTGTNAASAVSGTTNIGHTHASSTVTGTTTIDHTHGTSVVSGTTNIAHSHGTSTVSGITGSTTADNSLGQSVDHTHSDSGHAHFQQDFGVGGGGPVIGSRNDIYSAGGLANTNTGTASGTAALGGSTANHTHVVPSLTFNQSGSGTAAGQTLGLTNVSLASGVAAGQTLTVAAVALASGSAAGQTLALTNVALASGSAVGQVWSQTGSGSAAAQTWGQTGSGSAAAQVWSQSGSGSAAAQVWSQSGSGSAAAQVISGSTAAASVSMAHSHSVSGSAAAQVLSGDAETRPLNANVNYIIKT